MNGNNYKDAMVLHKGGVVKAVINDRLKALAEAGVTYYRDGGDILGASAYAREAAPDYGINYKTCIFAAHKQNNYGWIVGHAFTDSKDFYKLVLRAKAEKADFIKLMISGIMDFKSFGGLSGGGLELEEIPELIRIAHGEGFKIMTHTNGADRIKAAIEAGADSIEHGYFMDEACIGMLAQSDTIWVPTLAACSGFIGRAGFTEGIAAQNLAHQKSNVRLALKSGAYIAAGSDAGAFGVDPVNGIALEYALLYDSGMTAADIDRGSQKIIERFKYQ
jgi:imidazolonepropionase-like amidohydrolase